MSINPTLPPPGGSDSTGGATTVEQQGFLSTVTDPKVLQEAQDAIDNGTFDSWVSNYIKERREFFTNSEGDNPILPPDDPGWEPTNGIDIGPALGIEGNKFLSPNLIAVYTIIFMELAAILSQINLEEGMMEQAIVALIMDMAEDLGQLQKEQLKLEATMHLVSAIMTAVAGAVSIAGSIHSGVAGARGGGSDQLKSQRMQTIGMGYNGASQFIQAFDKLAQSIITFQKADLKKMETITEAGLRTFQEKALSAQTDTQRKAAEAFMQALQLLQQLLEKNFQAHNIGRQG